MKKVRMLNRRSQSALPATELGARLPWRRRRLRQRALVFSRETTIRDELSRSVGERFNCSVSSVASLPELAEALLSQHHAVIVIDIDFPSMGAETTLSLLEDASSLQPASRVFAVSAFKPWLQDAMAALRVAGILGKPLVAADLMGGTGVPHVAQDVAHYGAGNRQLSPREFETLVAIAHGYTVSDIATARQRSLKTVSTQKVAALTKVGFANAPALIKFFTRCQLNHVDPLFRDHAP